MVTALGMAGTIVGKEHRKAAELTSASTAPNFVFHRGFSLAAASGVVALALRCAEVATQA